MRFAGLIGLPYLPLALLAGWPGAGGFDLHAANATPPAPGPLCGRQDPLHLIGSLDPGVSLSVPGGTGHSPGLPFPDTSRRPDGPTDREVRARSRGWEVKRLESPDWKLLMTDRCALRGDAPLDAMRTLGVHAELALDALVASIGGDASDIRFSIRVFTDPDEFDVFASIAGAKGAASFYDPRNVEAVIYCPDERPRERAVRLLRHEVAHLYMDRVFDRRDPLWLCEGVAEWLENATWEDGRFRPGGESALHRQTLRTAMAAGQFVGLRRLLSANRDEFYADDRHALYYAEAWSLVRLLAREPGRLEKLCSGTKLGDLVKLADLEAEWKNSLQEKK